MDSARIRTVEFRQALRGYDRNEVDEVLEKIAEAVDLGQSPTALIRNAHFRGRWRGDHRGDVDEFMEILRTTSNWVAVPQPGFPLPHSVAQSTVPQATDSYRPTTNYPSFNPGTSSSSGMRGHPSSSPTEGQEGIGDLLEGIGSSGTRPSTTVKGTLDRVFFGLPALALYCVALLGLVGWSIATFVSDQVQNAEFARTGVVIHPRVVSRYHDDEGQDGVFDYLYVVIPACKCRVELPTTNLAGHPVGSRVPVRYNPKNPTDARIMVDANNGWLADFIPASFDAVVLFAFGYIAAGALLGIRRENKRIVQSRSITSTSG